MGQDTRREACLAGSSLMATRGEEGRNGKQARRAAGTQESSSVLQCEATAHGDQELLPILCARDPYHQPGTLQGPFTSLEVLSVV